MMRTWPALHVIRVDATDLAVTCPRPSDNHTSPSLPPRVGVKAAMPATDPFSGDFRPLPTLQFDSAPREPLPFAAVPRPLHDITSSTALNALNAVAGPSAAAATAAGAVRPKAKVYKDAIPAVWGPSQYGSTGGMGQRQRRAGGVGGADGGGRSEAGSGAGGWPRSGAGSDGSGIGGDGGVSEDGRARTRSNGVEVGGDEWMSAKIHAFWDRQDRILDLKSVLSAPRAKRS